MALTTITPVTVPFGARGIDPACRGYYTGEAQQIRVVTRHHLVIRVALGAKEAARYGADTADLLVRRSELADDVDRISLMLGTETVGNGVRAGLRTQLLAGLNSLREVLALPETA